MPKDPTSKRGELIVNFHILNIYPDHLAKSVKDILHGILPK